ncbi:MAG TPA: GNAT family N-acetyltransferase [candidate division Zixibacteria bacterium]|nr:GNAT family N-acetyltransferase [candidate division Zixibacteria bacterium]
MGFRRYRRPWASGGILCRFRNLKTEPEPANTWTLFESICQFIPDSSRFCDIFNLWVPPDFRRQGLAARLKRQLEIESHRRDIEMIYTRTERTNPHVIELNLKLGYREIRRNPI